TGCDVTDIGTGPTPLLYFSAVHNRADGAVMITGSHNPSEFNGFKTVCGSGTLHGETIQQVRCLIESRDFAKGTGSHRGEDITEAYLDALAPQFAFERRIKVVVDAGNGTAGPTVRRLFARLNCDITELFFDMDGRFPNHHPDPTLPDNLKHLRNAVREQNAD